MDFAIQNWRLVERDFQAIYGIADPMALSWRRFLVLLSSMSADSALISRWARETDPTLRAIDAHENNQWWKDELNKAIGRPVSRQPARVVSLDQFRGGETT